MTFIKPFIKKAYVFSSNLKGKAASDERDRLTHFKMKYQKGKKYGISIH